MSTKIILIEDDPLLVKMYKTKFSIEGFEVSVATDGEQGFELIQKINPDFVIMDMMMPKISGLDLLKKIKADLNYNNIKVLMLSNMQQQDRIREIKELGVVDFLIKADYTPSEIVNKVKQYLK